MRMRRALDGFTRCGRLRPRTCWSREWTCASSRSPARALAIANTPTARYAPPRLVRRIQHRRSQCETLAERLPACAGGGVMISSLPELVAASGVPGRPRHIAAMALSTAVRVIAHARQRCGSLPRAPRRVQRIYLMRIAVTLVL